MAPKLPDIDESIISRRNRIVSGLTRIVSRRGIVSDERSMRVFESDGLTAYRNLPLVVVLPETVDEVRSVLGYCHENKIKVVPRGSGTSLSGGALPLSDGVLLVMSRFTKILEIDVDNRFAVVQPGVTNLSISEAVSEHNLYYAPDPSSQIACSIGGNVAENAGGVHCLKYGLTANNITGVEMVLMDGRVIRLGGKHLDSERYDLLGVVTGSEGLLSVITEVTVRLLPKPESARALLISFGSTESAAQCVADIISSGIIPAGMEMMDRLATEAAESFVNAGYPIDEALLIVELDGVPAEVDHLIERVTAISQQNGSKSVEVSGSEEERLRFWAGRKAAFPAVGRISPDYYCVDGTIPRRALPRVLAKFKEFSTRYGLRIANVFHAGDGNLHPLILYDSHITGELEKAERLGADILELCVDVGGVLTGEHGVGVEKRDLMEFMFTEDDLSHQQRVKCAFDPEGLLNPGKVFPKLHRCAELGRMHIHGGKIPHPDIPRF